MNKSLKKFGSGVMKSANFITNVTGGRQAADYLGAKFAKPFVSKQNRSFVNSNVTGKQALMSLGKVGASLPVAGGGVYLLGKAMQKMAMKTTPKVMKSVPKITKKKTANTFVMPGTKQVVKLKQSSVNPTSLKHLKGDTKQRMIERKRVVDNMPIKK
jgi:hypothetical protein